MEEELEISITNEHQFSESTEQLSHILSNEFSTQNEKDNYEYIRTNTIEKNDCRVSEASPISIKALRELLQRAEDNGSTHVSIDYHCDHDEYDVYGFKILRATEADINLFNEMEKLKTDTAKEKRIKKLQDELKAIQNGKYEH